MDLAALPGGDLVQEGLADLDRGVESVPALLVSIGAPRLRRIGLPVPDTTFPSSERRLYDKLAETDPDSAHSGTTPWCGGSSASRTRRNAYSRLLCGKQLICCRSQVCESRFMRAWKLL